MNTNWLQRTELLIGKENLEKLKSSSVLIVGLGGVGSFAAEYICRSGIGRITLVDSDKVEITNLNRQLNALTSTLGSYKAEILASRLKDINPEAEIIVKREFLEGEKINTLLTSEHFDYVIDAIDTVTPKITLIASCIRNNIKIVSSMGSGGKLNPEAIKVTDISKTYECTLARVVRKQLKILGIKKGVKVVFSEEKNSGNIQENLTMQNKRSIIGTISYIPSIFGAFCASVVIRDLIEK